MKLHSNNDKNKGPSTWGMAALAAAALEDLDDAGGGTAESFEGGGTLPCGGAYIAVSFADMLRFNDAPPRARIATHGYGHLRTKLGLLVEVKSTGMYMIFLRNQNLRSDISLASRPQPQSPHLAPAKSRSVCT
jgi:hypothetical protein